MSSGKEFGTDAAGMFPEHIDDEVEGFDISQYFARLYLGAAGIHHTDLEYREG